MQPGVALKPWDPKTPYLEALKKVPAAEAYMSYLKLRPDYAESPAFFLDCASFFHQKKQGAVALKVLSNIAELQLENPQLLRVLAHRLEQTGELTLAIAVFEQVLEMRPEEPQSYRDLALALIARAESATHPDSVKADYERAITLLNEVVMQHWDRFAEIEVMALVALNRIIPVARENGVVDIPLDKRLIKKVDCDIRITMTWDADNTDIDLHVLEPSGEQAFYGHNRTTIGGRVSRDFTAGYGPEEYMLRKAMTGTYTVKAKFYGSASVKLLGGVTVQLNIYTHFGRPEQQRKSITVRLTEAKEMITIGELEF
jgi:tetratricopeptide (TPR) repeat protein